MIVRYNSLNRMEPPKFTLCNPGSIYTNEVVGRPVGILADHEAEEIVFNFNATSELNMRVKRVPREDPEENAHVLAVYKAIQNRRLIFVDDIGYFMITGVEDGFDGVSHCKDIKAKSIDIEIQQKMIPFISNGTYRFTTDETGTNKGILEMIVETLPLWTIGYVDESVKTKWRTFEDIDTSLNCLSFLLENIQDAYECIIVFDNIHRVINVYDQNNYACETDIHITKEDMINSLDITENADDLYTAITVLGNENVTISAINPLGTNTIYDFSYYIDWMSNGLKEKVKAWQDDVEAERDSYYDLNLAYYNQLAETSNLEMEIDKIDTQLTMYTRCRNNIVAESTNNTAMIESYNSVIVENDGTAITVYPEIADTLACVDGLISTCDAKKTTAMVELEQTKTKLESYQNDIQSIQDRLSIDTYFTDEEYEELCHYIYEGSYSDDYVTITDIMTYAEKFDQMKTLYDRALTQLLRVSRPSQEFNIDVENFISIKDFERWSEQLETGCLINVEINPNDIASLFLCTITINYDDHSLKLTFGNRFNKFDTKTLFNDVLGKISKSANTLNYVKEILYPIKSGEFNSMKEAVQTSRNLTMGQALTSANEEVVIDGSGYTGRKLLSDGIYDPKQVKLTGRSLVFTDDAWESCRVAIGEILFGDGNSTYGINAATIIGNMIVGNNLQIVDANGMPLLEVVDDKISSSVADINNRLTTVEQDSQSLLLSVEELQNTEVSSVVTKTGYKFNADGLTIHKSGEEIKNLLNNEGMYVSRVVGETEESILTANSDGVDAVNLTARQYLIVGDNSRFENYNNGSEQNRTACFHIGS